MKDIDHPARSFVANCISFIFWCIAAAVLAFVMLLVGYVGLEIGGTFLAMALVVIGFTGIGLFLNKPAVTFSSFLLTVVAALLIPAVQATVCSPTRVNCASNLKQIVLGLQHYEDTYKTFPSAYIPDPEGKPIRSWRVLLLPFLEQYGLEKQYDINEPWDAPVNASLAESCPDVYRCPMDSEPAGDTQYFAVVGAKLAWPGSEGRKLRDFSDGTMNTLMVVESHARGIKWTEPRDLTFNKTRWEINPQPPGSGLSSVHPGGANAALADGSVRFLSDKMDRQTLRALITAQGGESISTDW